MASRQGIGKLADVQSDPNFRYITAVKRGEMAMLRGLCACVVGLAASVPALAHHSFAMFDRAKTITVEGTVVSFEMVNPHSWLYVMTKDATGKPVEWAFEMGGLATMARVGFQKEWIKPGDRITVNFHPLKDGAYGGQYLGARLADGRDVTGGETGLGPAANQ
jgi:hypothetical protein